MMTKQIDKTIRHLKGSLKELNSIEIDDYRVKVESSNKTWLFGEFLDDSIRNIEILIESLELKYAEIHTIGSHENLKL